MWAYDLSGTRAYNKASSSSISPVCTNKRIHFYFTRKLDEREKPRYKQLTLALPTGLWPRSTIFFFFFHVTWLSSSSTMQMFFNAHDRFSSPFSSFFSFFFFDVTFSLLLVHSWKMFRKRVCRLSRARPPIIHHA